MANKYRAWTDGEVLTAANLIDYVQKNVVIPCDSSADYPDSSTRREGMAVYDKGADKLLVYSGSSTTGWTQPWNMPWGRVAFASTTTPQTTTSAVEQDLTGLSVTFTAVANRIYRLSGFVVGKWTSNGDGYVPLYAGTTQLVSWVQYAVANQYYTLAPAIDSTSLSGSTTVKLRATGPSALTTASATGYPAWIRVEDIGPNGAPA
jgi:hypothetical protein